MNEQQIMILKKLVNKELKIAKTTEYMTKLYNILYKLNDLHAKLIVEKTNYEN